MPGPLKFSLRAPNCDVEGCGALADLSTDGSEVDAFGRKAVPLLNVCNHHVNWPHADDAKAFAEGKSPSGRDISHAADAYHLRVNEFAPKGS